MVLFLAPEMGCVFWQPWGLGWWLACAKCPKAYRLYRGDSPCFVPPGGPGGWCLEGVLAPQPEGWPCARLARRTPTSPDPKTQTSVTGRDMLPPCPGPPETLSFHPDLVAEVL